MFHTLISIDPVDLVRDPCFLGGSTAYPTRKTVVVLLYELISCVCVCVCVCVFDG